MQAQHLSNFASETCAKLESWITALGIRQAGMETRVITTEQQLTRLGGENAHMKKEVDNEIMSVENVVEGESDNRRTEVDTLVNQCRESLSTLPHQTQSDSQQCQAWVMAELMERAII